VVAIAPAAEYFPHETVENAAGDWVGWVFPVAGRRVLAAETIGAHAAWFEAVLTAEGPVRVEQAFLFDREAFAPGPDPWLEIGVRLRLPEGWVELGLHQVRLLDRDDTPPSGLRFAWGGQVLETHVGAEIGRLAATDPDTPAAALGYRVAWPDAAWFEIADGDILRLRQGVDLLRDGGTLREVMVLVSDGASEVAMTVAFEVLNVTDLDDLPAPPPVVRLPPSPPVEPPASDAAAVPGPPVAAPPMVPISAVFWSRGELRPALLIGPLDSGAAPPEGWLAAVTRQGLVLLDTDSNRRFTQADHLLDAGRSAWTTPPDELAPGGDSRLDAGAAGAFRLLRFDRGGVSMPPDPGVSMPPDPGEAGGASSDWFA
jgi:hypothetical protein